MRTSLVAILVLLIPLSYGDEETKPDEFHGLKHGSSSYTKCGIPTYEVMGGGLIEGAAMWDRVGGSIPNLQILKKNR